MQISSSGAFLPSSGTCVTYKRALPLGLASGVQNPMKASGPSLKAWGLQTEPGVRGTPCNQASSGEPGVHAPFGVPEKQTRSGGGGHRSVA